MSDAQTQAYYEGDFSLTEEDIIPFIKAAGSQGITDGEVADRLIQGEIPQEMFFVIRQECTRACSDLYYEGRADRVKRRTVVGDRATTRSFYTMRDIPCEPRVRPGEKKVKEAVIAAVTPLYAQIAQLKAERDAAISKAHEIWAMLEKATTPA